MYRHRTFKRRNIVPTDDDRIAPTVLGHARGVRDADRIVRMAEHGDRHRIGVDQHRVPPAVIMTLELDDLAATGVAASQSKGPHGRLGSGIGKSHLIHMRQQPNQHFGHFNLNLEGGCEVRAASNLARDGFDDLWMRVTKRQGPESHHPVDVLPTVNVVEPRALAMRHVSRG